MGKDRFVNKTFLTHHLLNVMRCPIVDRLRRNKCSLHICRAGTFRVVSLKKELRSYEIKTVLFF